MAVLNERGTQTKWPLPVIVFGKSYCVEGTTDVSCIGSTVVAQLRYGAATDQHLHDRPSDIIELAHACTFRSRQSMRV